ncbi:MAG: class I SAM-dependent methyltransferase [Clostridiales bacterium]|nr:class I SAM-dependent methyltransferase [Clostridiales bacterium]
MRKYDRNAVFNIAVKALLFIVFFAAAFSCLEFLLFLPVVITLVIALAFGFAAVFLFSYLLRYTGFYYRYYAFVSVFLFREKQGKVYCPCCGKHFEHFEDERFYDDLKHYNPEMFKKSRQDVICDCCRSAPRQRIIAEWAEQNIELLESSKILYFAPELSMMLWFKKHGIRVTTADLFDKRTDLKLDLTAIDLPDSSEDIIFCNHVLEHVYDYKVALSELHRVLKEGGRLIISFPVNYEFDEVHEEKTGSAEERIRLFGQDDHLRVFGKDSRKILEEAGFEVGSIGLEGLPEEIVPVTGPADYDTNEIFVCIRK